MRIRSTLIAAVAVLCIGGARAELAPTPLPGDARLVQYEYDPDNTFLVLSRPKFLTNIEFGPDERIETVAGGDTKHWELTPTQSRRHLFVKPIYESIQTSMTVITNKRSYQFVLRSTGPDARWYQRVTWRYGATMLLDLRAQEEQASAAAVAAKAAEAEKEAQTLAVGVTPDQLRFGYQVTGEAPFKPVSIFDDGKMTWIRMPAQLQELPALFGIAEGTDLAIVNYVVKGDYIVAQRLMDQGVLKLGKQEVRFSRGQKPTGPFSWLRGGDN